MRILSFIVVLNLLGAINVLAADKEPTVDSILEKFTKAIGGKEAWAKIESRKIVADLEAMGSTSEWTLEAKAPNKRVSKVDLAGIGMIEDGFDGAKAWSKTQAGLREKEGDEFERSKREADFRREVRLKELYPSLTYKGTEKMDGTDVHVLEAKSTPTSKDRFYFNTNSGLLVRELSEFQGGDGNEVGVDIVHSDYREFEGLKYAYSRHFKLLVGGQPIFEFSLKFKQIKHNEKFDDAKFAKPAE